MYSYFYFSECYVHGGWFPVESYLLDNVDKIRHIPATIIQGRYDVTTPMKTAWDLHKVNQGRGVLINAFPIKKNAMILLLQRWPEAEFHVVPDAGHFFMEPGTIAKLIEITNKYKNLWQALKIFNDTVVFYWFMYSVMSVML